MEQAVTEFYWNEFKKFFHVKKKYFAQFSKTRKKIKHWNTETSERASYRFSENMDYANTYFDYWWKV